MLEPFFWGGIRQKNMFFFGSLTWVTWFEFGIRQDRHERSDRSNEGCLVSEINGTKTTNSWVNVIAIAEQLGILPPNLPWKFKNLAISGNLTKFHIPKLIRWWFQKLFIFTLAWGNDPTWLIFSNGLVQPPTRKLFQFVVEKSLLSCLSASNQRGEVGWVFFFMFRHEASYFHISHFDFNIRMSRRFPDNVSCLAIQLLWIYTTDHWNHAIKRRQATQLCRSIFSKFWNISKIWSWFCTSNPPDISLFIRFQISYSPEIEHR